jgi:hypothetical protein
MIKAKKGISFLFVLLLLVVFTLPAAAQDKLTVTVTTSASCAQVDFKIVVEGGSTPYSVDLNFGDTQSYHAVDITESTILTSNDYPSHGGWMWDITVHDGGGLLGEADGLVVLKGPSVTLSSVPFPPLLTLDESGNASAEFTADASGGTVPDKYVWDLDGDGVPDVGQLGDTASHTYTEAGEYKAEVVVTDSCGFTASATLKVIVIDPKDEDSCHPTALKIAEAVSSIFPDQAEDWYICEEIFNIFDGSVFGYQVGFGRMWHAYQLTQTIDDLKWEEIRDWHLNYSGWGVLVQLDRFADLLEMETYGIRDLMELVISGEQSLGDIRTAVRSFLRYEADFGDALERINNGANPGELGQFYKLASDLGVEDLTILDGYLAKGMTLPELRHAANFAERVEAEWIEIFEAKTFNYSWGEIGQAYRLADEGASAADILAIMKGGVQEYRASQREDARNEREGERTAREEERADRTAERLAEQFENADADRAMELYNGECVGSWGCVRKALRDEDRVGAASDRNERTAEKIASQYSQYGVTKEDVEIIFLNHGEDWSRVRAYYRDLHQGEHGKGKNK